MKNKIIFRSNNENYFPTFSLDFDTDFLSENVGEYDSVEDYVESFRKLEGDDDKEFFIGVVFEIPLEQYLSDLFNEFLELNGIQFDRNSVEEYEEEKGKKIFELFGIDSIEGNLTLDTGEVLNYKGDYDNLIEIEDEWLHNLEEWSGQYFKYIIYIM